MAEPCAQGKRGIKFTRFLGLAKFRNLNETHAHTACAILLLLLAAIYIFIVAYASLLKTASFHLLKSLFYTHNIH